jgi:hypothetical protein
MGAPSWLVKLPQPGLMAIGDSLVNGMRSYSINDAMAASSIPALLGAAMHTTPGFASFQSARYPEPILIDVEAQLARHATSESAFALVQVLNALPAIKADVTQNGRDWLDRFEKEPTEGPVAFDNLAIAGARIEDAFELTYDQLEARIEAIAPVLRREDDPLKWSGNWPASDPTAAGAWGVGDVHISLNARHLRNPDNRDGLGKMTVLDMVEARQPRVLLVNMGPNHGLVDVVMRGKGEKGMNGLRAFAAAWPPCARALARLRSVEVVVMLLMPRPSQTPCLAPPNPSPQPELEPAPTRPDRYFSRYMSALSPVARFDEEMDEINATVQASMVAAFQGSGKHLVFVSLADVLGAHDYKHRRGPKLPGGASGREYSNYPLGRLTSLFHGSRLRGGFCGLDQIHPTTIGYRSVASAVQEALAAVPGAPGFDPITVTDAGDPFLLNPHWATIAALDGLYPRAVAGGPEATVLAHPNAEGTRRLIFQAEWLR